MVKILELLESEPVAIIHLHLTGFPLLKLEIKLDAAKWQHLKLSITLNYHALWRKGECVCLKILLKRGEQVVCRVARQLRKVMCVNNVCHL